MLCFSRRARAAALTASSWTALELVASARDALLLESLRARAAAGRGCSLQHCLRAREGAGQASLSTHARRRGQGSSRKAGFTLSE
jgi:hypothetical protein